MNNEPVAWMHKTIPSWVSTFIYPETELDEWLPLYTHPIKEQDESFDRTASHMAGEYVSHPVKQQDTDCQYCKQGCIRCGARKQLTDEEIWELSDMVLNNSDVIGFARAILRKAQGK